MSSLFLKLRAQSGTLVFVAVASALAATEASAADAYFTPQLETAVESHDNLNLRPRRNEDGTEIDLEKGSQTGYSATVGGIAGLRSPTGVTEVRPRFLFQKFSDRDKLAQSNGYLDLRSSYRMVRSRFSLLGRYSQENEYNAEISEAQFDEFDPDANPDTTPEDATGRLVFTDSKITRLLVVPDYSFQLNQRTGIGVRGLYQTADYSGGLNTSRDYSFGQATGYLSWELNQRASLETGVYTTRYETDDNENETKSNGLSANLRYVWNPTFTATAGLKVEDTKISRVDAAEESSKSWGFQLGVRRRGEISGIEASVGRMFSPSFGGVRVARDEVRAQYTRMLAPLWEASAAVRAFRNKSLGDVDDSDRKFARADLEVTRQLSRTWTVSGGYSYIWQEYYVDEASGKDNVFMLRVGYEGLGPPTR